MTSDEKKNTGLAARIKMAIAGLALVGVLAGGAVAIADVDPVSAEDTTEDTTETARTWFRTRGLSWQ